MAAAASLVPHMATSSREERLNLAPEGQAPHIPRAAAQILRLLPAFTSPAKLKQKILDSTSTPTGVSALDFFINDTRELQDSILAFPTSNQPVVDTTLKDT